tara:strand:+ start:16 stop:384 length:369 start_codon:yes stop_codon:yes gene_type:complete
MNENLITYKQAILAKEVGFKTADGTGLFYTRAGELAANTAGRNNFNFEGYEAPTQSVLCAWIRQRDDLHIGANSGYSGYFYFVNTTKGEYFFNSLELNFKTYEDAISGGLDCILNYIRRKKR